MLFLSEATNSELETALAGGGMVFLLPNSLPIPPFFSSTASDSAASSLMYPFAATTTPLWELCEL
jgi:hypothetical protein